MNDTTDRIHLMENAEEIRTSFEESIRFQKDLKARLEEEGRAHDESNRLAEEQLEVAEQILAQVGAHSAVLEAMDDIVEQLEARFARENQQYEALIKVLELREEASERMLARIDEEDRVADALEAELRALRTRFGVTVV